MITTRSTTFAADVELLASVRAFAVQAHRQLGGRWDRDLVELVVAELAANAVVHTGADATLALTSLPDGSLQIEVSDRDPRVPSVVDSDPWDVEGHRGLFLVDALSQSWGVEPSATGKRVWAILPAVDDLADAPGTSPAARSADDASIDA